MPRKRRGVCCTCQARFFLGSEHPPLGEVPLPCATPGCAGAVTYDPSRNGDRGRVTYPRKAGTT